MKIPAFQKWRRMVRVVTNRIRAIGGKGAPRARGEERQEPEKPPAELPPPRGEVDPP